MAYYEDLSDYVDSAPGWRKGAKNVGWLDRNHKFDLATPTEATLSQLWEHCRIFVMETRGRHWCELCEPTSDIFAERKGQQIHLGSSEIRVWSKTGEVYAAPNLIFHYVHTHRYKPPDEFLRALEEGISPSTKLYFEKLKDADWDWIEARVPQVNKVAFKFEKVAGELERIEVPITVFWDRS